MIVRLANYRAGWITQGMFITVLAPDKPVDEQCMRTYYGMTPEHKHYAELQRPRKVARIVLMKPNGSFVVVPMTPTTVEIPT